MKSITINELNKLEKQGLKEFEVSQSTEELEKVRVKYLGRKSKLTKLLRSIKDLPKADKPVIGSRLNEVRRTFEKQHTIQSKKVKIDSEIKNAEVLDITAPGKEVKIGHIHPNTQMIWEIEDIFQRMGFEVFEPFDVDDDYHSFTSLNMPEDHPARDIWDTFWTQEGFIPIPHTSAMQNRILKTRKPPIQAVVIGHTYRNERTDARHEHTLFQCEGIYVDKGISLSDMIGTLQQFFSEVFRKEVKVRVDPDYFPFVEPGNGMALSCTLCDMKGCRVCKGTGWLEILGCGMIHPNVLAEGNVDHKVYSGFAWGFGIDRLVMLRDRIEDIRHFHSGDLRFLKQF